MTPTVTSASRIWDDAPHNAFTGLTRFRGGWLAVFREGSTHTSPDGQIRVIASDDGRRWRPLAALASPYPHLPDVRDPKIAVTPDGSLRLLTCARNYHTPADFQPLQSASPDGVSWTALAPVAEPGLWMWGLAAGAGSLFGTAYGPYRGHAPDAGVVLYRDLGDGDFARVALMHGAGEYMGEPAGVFDADGAVVLCRRSSPADPALTALIGTSPPPYRQWTWRDTGVHVGGPAIIRTPAGQFFAAGRRLHGEPRTAVWRLDPDRGELSDAVTLPSGGDCSYPGLAWHDGQLWVSYYSSHERKTSIYLATLSVE